MHPVTPNIQPPRADLSPWLIVTDTGLRKTCGAVS